MAYFWCDKCDAGSFGKRCLNCGKGGEVDRRKALRALIHAARVFAGPVAVPDRDVALVLAVNEYERVHGLKSLKQRRERAKT